MRWGLIVVTALSVLTGATAAKPWPVSRALTVAEGAFPAAFDGTPVPPGGPAGRSVCSNGLVAFASNRTQDAFTQIYSISLDGQRTDVSRTIGPDSNPQPSPDGSKLAFWTRGQLVVADADGSDPQRIPTPVGADYGPTTVAWSPDSKQLAVTAVAHSRVTSESLVAVLELASGRWTETAGLGARAPQWSPDGTTIAYDAYGTGDVFLWPPGGGAPTRLASGTVTSWSPDGNHMLIGSSTGQAEVVPVGGGSPVGIPDLSDVVWVPNSSRLIGLKVGPGGNTLETVAVDGTDPRVVATDVRFSGPRVSPDGRRVVFVRASDDHIVISGLDGQALRDLGRWDAGPYDLHFQFAATWSPDGTKIVYWSGGKIIAANTDTGTRRTLAGGPADAPEQWPVWSADSSRVFDAISDATGNTDIYVADPNGTGVRRVYGDQVPEGGPAWSPDGRRLAFIRYSSPPALVVTDLASHARVLTTLPADRTFSPASLSLSPDGPRPGRPAWSPDGRTIAVTTSKGVELVDVRARNVRLWQKPFGEGLPVAVAWSRIGAFATTDGLDESSVWISGKRGVRAFAIYGWTDPDYGDVSGLATSLTWSPDGTRLAYLRYGAENGTGYFAWVTESTRIIDTTAGKTGRAPLISWDFSWSPDGRYFILGGWDAIITTTTGKQVARLTGLRAVYPSWQSLCGKRGRP